jgi:Trk-type K+ transport system membrane component
MGHVTPRAEAEPVLEYTAARPAGGGWGAVRFMLLAYLTFTALAFLALHLPGVGVTGQEIGFRRAVFAAVNATTLTGFQQDVGSSQAGADVLRLVVTVGATLFSLVCGGMALVRIIPLRYTDAQVAAGAGAATLVAMLVGAAFLGSDRGVLPALLLAASAFGNSGLYSGRLPGVLDWEVHVILLPLAFAGALGVPVLMEAFDRLTGSGRALSAHTRTVLVLAAGFYLLGFALLAVSHAAVRSPNAGGGGMSHSVALASAFAVNSRTTGLPLELAGAFARPAQWVLVALMVVGGSPGGTAGGIKTTAVYQMVTGFRDALRGRRQVSRAFGIAGCWVGAYLAVVAVGFLLLLITEPDTPDRLLFLAVSAASNVGLSHDPVSSTGNGLFTLSALMLAGRVLPLLVLWWMASAPGERDAVAVG